MWHNYDDWRYKKQETFYDTDEFDRDVLKSNYRNKFRDQYAYEKRRLKWNSFDKNSIDYYSIDKNHHRRENYRSSRYDVYNDNYENKRSNKRPFYKCEQVSDYPNKRRFDYDSNYSKSSLSRANDFSSSVYQDYLDSKKSPRKKHYRTPEKETKRFKDDNEGHLIYQIGDIIQDRYKILKNIGEGTFGKVVKVFDSKRNKKVALKIIKNVNKYRKAAKFEIKVLNKIKKWDPDDKSLCVKILDWCDYNGHVCISFDVLGLSLYDFMKLSDYNGFPVVHIKTIAHQLCHAVKFLHNHNLAHTDLKPENVMFVNSDTITVYDHSLRKDVDYIKNPEIRLIDFGSATFDYEHHSSIITTRHYRAPEVILGLGWNESCDVWSIGCILFELYKGQALFQTHKDLEHLAMMEKTLGPLPKYLIKRSKAKFFHNEKLDWDPKASCAKYVEKYCKSLNSYIKDNRDENVEDLFNLIKEMLNYDPEHRITLRYALRHKFFDT